MIFNESEEKKLNSKGKKRKFSENDQETNKIGQKEKKHESKKSKKHIIHLEDALMEVKKARHSEGSEETTYINNGSEELFSKNYPHTKKKKLKHKHRDHTQEEPVTNFHESQVSEDFIDTEMEYCNIKKSKKKKKDKHPKSGEDEEHISDNSGLEFVKKKNKKKKKKKKKDKHKTAVDLWNIPLSQENHDDCNGINHKVTSVEKNKLNEEPTTSHQSQSDKNRNENYSADVFDNSTPKQKKHKKHKHKSKEFIAEDGDSTDYSYFDPSVEYSKLKKTTEKEKHKKERITHHYETDSELSQQEDRTIDKITQDSEDNKFRIKKKKKKNHKHKTPEEDYDSFTSTDLFTDSDVGLNKSKIDNHHIQQEPENGQSDHHNTNNITSIDIVGQCNGSKRESPPCAKSESVSSTNTYTLEVQGIDSSMSSDSSTKRNDTQSSKPQPRPDRTEVTSILDRRHFQELLDEHKDSRLTHDQTEKLGFLSVMLPWPVPPLHTIETRTAGNPSREQRERMKALGVDIKLGVYSRAEDVQIKNNWLHFCKLHDLPDDPAPFINYSRSNVQLAERVKFAQFLAHNLNDRPLNTVYKRFQRLFRHEDFKSGKFSTTEDNIIIDYVKSSNSPTPYADLAKILNRDNLAVEKRFKYICPQRKDVEYNWELKSDVDKFVKNLLSITKLSTVEDLKERNITLKEWKKLSKQLGVANAKLRQAWLNTIHPRLFVKKDTVTGDIKNKLIEKLIERDEQDWRTVNWDEIAQEFEGFTGSKLNKLLKTAVRCFVPDFQRHDLRKSLQHLQMVLGTKGFTRRKLVKLDFKEHESEDL